MLGKREEGYVEDKRGKGKSRNGGRVGVGS